MPPLLTLLRERLRTAVWRRVRIGVAAVCLVIAAAAALGAARRPTTQAPERSVPVVVAARVLPAGHVLHRGDLVVARWPDSARPAAALTAPNPLIGERLSGPVGTGEPVTRLRLVGSTLTAGLAPGTVATTVLVGAEVARLVHAGDRIDLVAGEPADPTAGVGSPTAPEAGAAVFVARDVLVLAVLAPSIADPFGGSATQLVLATDRHLALRITALQAARAFAVVVDPP